MPATKINIDHILNKMEELIDCRYQKYPNDTALMQLLREFKECLPEVDDYFHKAFRQCDITPSGRIDNAIWYLLNGTELFWIVLEHFRDGREIPTRYRRKTDGSNY